MAGIKYPRFFVYGLVDPRDLSLRYIGKSCNGITVPNRHRRTNTKINNNPAKRAWVKELENLGRTYQVQVLEEFVSNDGLGQAERDWIAQARHLGLPLFNITDGGENEPGATMSIELRAIISRTNRGTIKSPETRRRMSVAKKGHVVSEEARRKIGDATKGRKHSADTRAKMSLSRSNLSVANVIDIRAGRIAGVDPKELASRYGVSRGTIYNIANRQKWKHVP